MNLGFANSGMQTLSLHGQFKSESKRAQLLGTIEQMYLNTVGETIGVGTSKIQRSMIAHRRLGLPIR